MARREVARDLFEIEEHEVVLESHEPSLSSASYLSATFGEDTALGPQVRHLGSFPAVTHPHRDEFLMHAAFASGELVLAAEEQGVWRVDLIPENNSARRALSLGKLRPTALHRVGDALYVGVLDDEKPRLGWLDLTERTPAFRELSAPAKARRKAYDLFARHSDASRDDTINESQGGTDKLPVVEEHFPSDPGEKKLLVAGDKFTHWTGLAFDPFGGRVQFWRGNPRVAVLAAVRQQGVDVHVPRVARRIRRVD